MARRSTQANAYAIDQITSFNGGLNTEDPVVIEDNELAQADNVVYTLQGRVTPRPGINKRYATDFANTPVIGLSPYYRTDGTSKLVIASGTNLYTDNPHLIYSYDSQNDWKNANTKYNANLDTSPGDVVIPTVFTEDFSEGNFLRFKTADSGWTIDTSTGTKIAKGTGTQQKLIYELSSSEGYSSIYTKVVCQFAEANQRHFPVMFNTSSSTTIQAVVADSDGHFKYHNGTGLVNFPTDMVYTNGAWYTVEVWISQGYLYVTINGLSLTPNGVAMKDTKNNSQTSIQQLQIQNADTTSATMWVSGIVVNPMAAVFTRNSSAYKSDGIQVTANTPRYETGKFGQAIMVEEGTTNYFGTYATTFDSGQVVFYPSGLAAGKTWADCWDNNEKAYHGGHNITMYQLQMQNSKLDIGSAVAQDTEFTFTWEHKGYLWSVKVFYSTDGTTWTNWDKNTIYTVTKYYNCELDYWEWVTQLHLKVDGQKLTSSNPIDYWKRIGFTFKVPAGTRYIKIEFDWYDAYRTYPAGGWVRNFQLEQKPYATSFIDGTRSPETLTIPTAGVLSVNEGTIKFWTKLNTLNSNDYNAFFTAGDVSGPGPRILIMRDFAVNPNKIMIWDGDGSTESTLTSLTTLQANTWYYVAFIWSPSGRKLYVNGVLEASNTRSNSLGFATLAKIGSWWGRGYLNGLIDDLQIYNRALTDVEIAADYNSGLPASWDESTTYLLSFDNNLNLPANRQGYWMSPVLKCDSSIDYQSLRVSWTDTENANSTLVALVVTSDDPNTLSWDTPYVLVNGELIDSTRLTLKQYVQIKFILQLINNGDSPVLHSATVTWGANPTVSLLTSGLSAASNYSFSQLMDKLIICNGVDVPKQYDGTSVTDITNAPRAYLTCVYKNRVFMAKTDQDRSSIWFSGIQNVTDWTSQDAGVIAVNPNDGDEIMAFLPTSTLLIIAKQRTCYYLQGYSPDTFQVSVAGIGGTISPYGIIQTPYGIFRLDEDGVWATDFRKQVLITKKIQRIWDSLNHKTINKAVLYYYKDNLLVSVAEAGSFYNNLLLVYDLIHKAWAVWRTMDASVFTEFREYGEVHYLYGSSSSGNVFEIDGNSDSGVPVVGTITTKNFAYVTENFIKRVKWLDISFGNTNANLSSNVTVTILVDGTTTKTYSFTVPANTVSKTYRVYPPPFGSTISVQLSLTGATVLHSIAITYYPRVPRPQRIL